MATLVVLQPDLDGEDLAPVAADVAGDVFPNDGKVVLYFKNTDSGTKTITVLSTGNLCSFAKDDPIHDAVVTLAAGNITPVEKEMGPFPIRQFNDANKNGRITYSDVTGVTVRAKRI